MAESSPFDKYVSEMVANANLLSRENLIALAALMPGMQETITGTDEVSTLKSVLDKQMAMFSRLSLLAVASNDVHEVQKVMAGTKNLMDLLMKFQEKIDLQSRATHVENAITEALNESKDPILKARYLELLAKALRKRG